MLQSPINMDITIQDEDDLTVDAGGGSSLAAFSPLDITFSANINARSYVAVSSSAGSKSLGKPRQAQTSRRRIAARVMDRLLKEATPTAHLESITEDEDMTDDQ